MSIEIDLNTLPSSFEIPITKYFPESQLEGNKSKNNQKETQTSKKFSFEEIDITDAVSSIYFHQGETNLLISIYGPKEAKFRDKVKNEKANIEVYTKFSNESKQKELVASINNKIKQFAKSIILSKSYPKCQINLCINILSENDDLFILLSHIFNGIMLCLCLSGIDLKCMALSQAFHINDEASLIVIIDANDDRKVLNVDSSCPLMIDEFNKCIEDTKNYVKDLYDKIKKILYDKIKI